MTLELSGGQIAILNQEGHQLITGGPGSGKTTVAILKAAQQIREALRPEQRVLFLSFARATVSRVVEAISDEPSVTGAERSRIEVDTYHSFFWRLIVAHGYLLGLPRRPKILTPPNEGIALSAVRTSFPKANQRTAEQETELAKLESEERWRLAREEGLICFDLFVECATLLLTRSQKLRRLVANRYPVIILDEFQDTNAEQWSAVRAMGEFSTLIALADPEQRIFDFIGADPKRLEHFKEMFAPCVTDLGADNHRSRGTEIAQFGNDVLTGTFRENAYNGVAFGTFPSNEGQAYSVLRSEIMQARKRLIDAEVREWSLVVLVPTKRMMRAVSDQLRIQAGKLPPITHIAAIDMEAAILAAEVVSYLMQPDATLAGLVNLSAAYFRGKGGNEPTKAGLDEAARIEAAYQKAVQNRRVGKAVPRKSVMVAFESVFEEARMLNMTGDPDADWQAVRRVLEKGNCTRLSEIGAEVRNVRLLDRGTLLRQSLAADWRTYGTYKNGLDIVRRAFIEEHFASAHRPETGVIVMNMHKAKGKQFDEVIIFEGWPKRARNEIVANPDRIVRSNIRTNDLGQARQNLRVSVTRARMRTTLLTPADDPCVLLIPA